MIKPTQFKKAFNKTQLINSEIETLVNEGQYVSAFVLKFLFLEQFLEIFISLVYLQLNNEKATDLLELAREDISGSTFGHKVMYLQKLNKKFKLGIKEPLFRKLQKISSFRNKTVHRLLHSDTDIDILNRGAKKWITEIEVMHEELFSEYLRG